MTDTITPEQRRKNMQAVRSRDTEPEKTVRRGLHGKGFRYRLGTSVCGMTPDIALPKWKTVIFVHGCFWHRHEGCILAARPKTHTSFWEEKFKRNRKRDSRQITELIAAGWRVCVVWECSLKKGSSGTIEKITDFIRNGTMPLWISDSSDGSEHQISAPGSRHSE